MLLIPESTEGLTKLLRSKSITPAQIVDIASRFDELDLYFPNKNIFIIELIDARWNDQKLTKFKQDFKIWKLYNDFFSSLTDATIQKKLLKDLKFIPHLLATLNLVNFNISEFLEELKRTCVLANSLIRTEVSLDNAISILGKTLRLIQQTNCSHEDLIYEIIHLTDISNTVTVSTKASDRYCNELLLPTIKHFVKFGSNVTILSELFFRFLFDDSINSVQQLEKFVQTNDTSLEPADCVLLFEKSISFLSKENFLKLEKIFVIITSIQKQLAPILLNKLSVSKKTMSQEFLNELLNETIKNPVYDIEFWSLILHILNLDVEIGILHFEQLIELISERKSVDPVSVENVWSRLIQCFVDAREYPGFLEKIRDYCTTHKKSSSFLLEEPRYSSKISRNVTMLSVMQLKTIISSLIHEILASVIMHEESALILKLTLKGLTRLSYISLPELKPVITKVFDASAEHPSRLWEIWYLAMEVYDDIVPLNSLESIDDQISVFLPFKSKSKELFYYFFKLREYKDYNILPIVDEFLAFLRESSEEAQKAALKDALTKWCSLVNFTFPREALDILTGILVSGSNIELLGVIFEDDYIFEEPNIMFALVHKLCELFDSEVALSQIIQIPIQCINKNTRVTLLNNVSCKEKVTKLDTMLMGHLLENPTFKSHMESQMDYLYSMLSRTETLLTYENIAVEKVWQNHLNQMKEKSSITFIQESTKIIVNGMKECSDDTIYFQLAFLALKVCDSNALDSLKASFVHNCLKKLPSSVTNIRLLTWLLRVLYFTFKEDHSCIPKENSLLRDISVLQKSVKPKDPSEDKDLKTSSFLLYSVLFNDKPEYLYAHYMVLRSDGIESDGILPAIEHSVKMCNLAQFNEIFANIVFSLSTCDLIFNEAILELYAMQIKHLTKNNSVGSHLFVRSISELYTNCENFRNAKKPILEVLDAIQSLLISKQWLFSQYCIEMLFPMCLKIVLIMTKGAQTNDDIFISTNKIISNIFLAHGVKLSNRHHLVNSFLCASIELIADCENTGLSPLSAKSLSRLIINFVEPGKNSNHNFNKKNILSSNIGLQKKLLRKYVPIILIKYIHLSIFSPFGASSKKELAISMYSIFDLLSQAELNMVIGALDNAGRQYFRNLYSDYKKVGKWDSTV